MNTEQKRIFDEDYMPFIIKWGKITCLIAVPAVFIPAIVLMVVFGVKPSIEGLITGFFSLFSAMFAWYIVDPITLFPILHVPGMYLTYLAGNSKEVRAPAASSALSSTGVEAGTPEGTIISAIAISTSVFVSIAVMTLVAVAGNAILSALPDDMILALNYLLPALFGAMFMQRIMMDYKSAAIVIPIAFILRVLNVKGVFAFLPFGGGYAQILLSVLVGVFVAKHIHSRKTSE